MFGDAVPQILAPLPACIPALRRRTRNVSLQQATMLAQKQASAYHSCIVSTQ